VERSRTRAEFLKAHFHHYSQQRVQAKGDVPRCAAEKHGRASLRFVGIPKGDQAADRDEEALSSFTRSLFTKLLFDFT
jgi:hypothetical protein